MAVPIAVTPPSSVQNLINTSSRRFDGKLRSLDDRDLLQWGLALCFITEDPHLPSHFYLLGLMFVDQNSGYYSGAQLKDCSSLVIEERSLGFRAPIKSKVERPFRRTGGRGGGWQNTPLGTTFLTEGIKTFVKITNLCLGM